MLVIFIGIIGVITGILFMVISFLVEDASEILSIIIGSIGFILLCVGIIFGIGSLGLIGKKADNRELFLIEQQEYIVLTQYINSTKSDSILESEDMMNRIKDYNNFVIGKQNDMTRPLLKYYAEGADWNELKLIDLNLLYEGE